MRSIMNGTHEQPPSRKAKRRLADTLARYAPKIAGVLHFEPVFEIHEDSRIGQLRRAYAEAVDYNRDLLGLLRERPEIEVRSVEPNIMGTNPLNPTTIIHWTFRPGV